MYSKKIKEEFQNILDGKFVIGYNQTFKKYLINYKTLGDCCQQCKLEKWEGKILILEIHHKDGDRYNNKLENLELLCPNCHSITNTWKKRKGKNSKIEDEEWIKVIRENQDKSINYILVNILGKSNTASYYQKVKKLCIEHNIEVPKKSNSKIYPKIYNKNTTKQQRYLQILENSDIDFSKRTWGETVAKLLKITPQYALKLVKTKYPHLLK